MISDNRYTPWDPPYEIRPIVGPDSIWGQFIGLNRIVLASSDLQTFSEDFFFIYIQCLPEYTTYPEISSTMILKDDFNINPIPEIKPSKKSIALALYEFR